MRYARLGGSGLKVSVVALGSWLTYGGTVDDRQARRCIRSALEAGVNLIDTADIYSHGKAERVIGEALRGRDRRYIVIATKAYFPMSDGVNDRGLSRKHLTESVTASLDRLGTDYVDVYQCHRYDDTTPIDEVVRTMGDLIRRGLVLYWGVSVWPADRIVEACRIADALGVPRPISHQAAYSLLDRTIEAEIVPTCRDNGLDQLVFSPLAQGVLTGKYSGGNVPDGSRGADDQNRRFMERYLDGDVLERVDRAAGLAREAGLTLPQLALAWVLARPGVASAVFGATRPEQIEENVRAVDVELEPELVDRVEKLLDPVGTGM